MRVWVGAFTAWLVQQGVLGFGCESFLGKEEEEYKKAATIFFYLCKNTNLVYLQKHQSFLSLQNTQQWKCKGKTKKH
jgi:hypothetical protein